MRERPRLTPGLEDFGRRLHEAAAAEIEHERRAVAFGRRRTLVLAVLAALLAMAVGAGAGALLTREGEPVPQEPRERTRSLPPDPAVVPGSAVADPAGGLPWALRVFATPDGRDCVVAGRLRGGRIGIVQDGRFRVLPQQTTAACEDVGAAGLLVNAQLRTRPDRTVVYGLTRGRGPVRVTIGGREYRVTPGALGSFLLVRPGVAPRGIVIRTVVDGRTIRKVY